MRRKSWMQINDAARKISVKSVANWQFFYCKSSLTQFLFDIFFVVRSNTCSRLTCFRRLINGVGEKRVMALCLLQKCSSSGKYLNMG